MKGVATPLFLRALHIRDLLYLDRDRFLASIIQQARRLRHVLAVQTASYFLPDSSPRETPHLPFLGLPYTEEIAFLLRHIYPVKLEIHLLTAPPQLGRRFRKWAPITFIVPRVIMVLW